MRLAASLFTSAALQTSFVALALLGTWHIEELRVAEPLDFHDVTLQPVAFELLVIPPVEEEEVEELAASVEEGPPPAAEEEEPEAQVHEPEPRAVAAVVKPRPKAPPVVEEPPKPELSPPPTQEIKPVAIAAPDAPDEVPTTPAPLAAEEAPRADVQPGAALASAGAAAATPSAVASTGGGSRAGAPRGQNPAAQGGGPGGGVDRAGLLRDYKLKVFATVDHNKTLPLAVRRARLEGTVYLLVTFDSAGQILDVKVRKSSGHAALDKGAMETLLAIKQLPPPPHELNWGKKSLTIPIRYQIN